MNNLEIVLIYLVLALNLILGSIVLVSGPRKLSNQIFAFMTASIIIWISAYFWENHGLNKQISSFLLRTDFTFAGIVSYFWLIFCLYFSKDDHSKNISYSFYLGIVPVVFGFLCFTDLIINNFRIVNAVIAFDRGFLYFFYLVFIFSYMFGGCLILLYRFKKASHNMRQQITYILIGAFLTLVMILFVTLILPQVINISVNIARLGIYSILFLVGFMAYAIIKYQLFDIRVILTQTATMIIVIALIAQTLFSKTVLQGLVNGVILIAMAYGGYLLVKSTQQEIKRRKQLEDLSNKLTQANEKLEEDKENLVKLDRMKDEFLQMATHELNTPISVIQGKLSMIIDEDMGGFGPKQKEFLKTVNDNSVRLAHLAKDLLNVTRIDQDRLALTKTDVNLVELAEKIVADLQIKAKQANDVLVYEKSVQPVPNLFIDQTKISEVLNNLLVNATKFTKNGTITVKIEPHNDEVIVSVADTGVGIDKLSQTHLFEKFHQVGRFDPENPVEQQGTGLGLYISKRLVELHHGKIWLESDAGKGTKFFFSLPLNHIDNEVKNG